MSKVKGAGTVDQPWTLKTLNPKNNRMRAK